MHELPTLMQTARQGPRPEHDLDQICTHLAFAHPRGRNIARKSIAFSPSAREHWNGAPWAHALRAQNFRGSRLPNFRIFVPQPGLPGPTPPQHRCGGLPLVGTPREASQKRNSRKSIAITLLVSSPEKNGLQPKSKGGWGTRPSCLSAHRAYTHPPSCIPAHCASAHCAPAHRADPPIVPPPIVSPRPSCPTAKRYRHVK